MGPRAQLEPRSRRDLLLGVLFGTAGLAGGAAWPLQANALPAMVLAFPRDRGAHADFRTEWWYITGQATTAGSDPRTFGFQLTFFRSRLAETAAMTSKFAAKQLIFAHAAVTDVRGKKLWHDQRIARQGFDIASASEKDMAITLRDWTLKADGSSYTASLPATDFALSLEFKETQGVLLQGNKGLSRKGPDEKQASYYYSQPQLATRGSLQIKGENFAVTGKAWLDHEWSQELLHPSAVGWDWIGMNLDDGSALTAFRLRDKDGDAVWEGGSFRSAAGELRVFSQSEVSFKAVRSWKSPLTQTTYPVEWRVSTPAYWEGLSELTDNKNQRVGGGYLEMTGYGQPLKL